MFIKVICVLCAVAAVSTYPAEMFGGRNNVAPSTDFFSNFIPKGIMRNMTSNPILQWIPGFITKTINAARERKMMKQMQQSMMTDVDMGGLGGMMVQSPGGSTGLSLSNRGGQGFVMATDNPMTDYLAGSFGGMADGMM
ncbi:uncharacterized protein LOC117340072 [Pecten maximus]|uniref:uncharacterized protein LOC117340072 n=1 Tax=Pecten maximus TaxID=6579 RepID=UPI0014589EF5|nr:uncharacterized protein LOC117340072 [Pecten maximus]